MLLLNRKKTVSKSSNSEVISNATVNALQTIETVESSVATYSDTTTISMVTVTFSITRQPNGQFRYDVKDYFRAYNTAKESFNDHGKSLRSNPRYANAFLTTDPFEFARCIAAAGYATGPTYFQFMEQLIKKFSEIIKTNKL